MPRQNHGLGREMQREAGTAPKYWRRYVMDQKIHLVQPPTLKSYNTQFRTKLMYICWRRVEDRPCIL